ncbi:MAG TPA: helix-turn-helix domain-containing protein [Candidatus Eisenbergiella merdigallinarum]|uniref:Helix-turn-helix domain-containing protein n=1 Tax=Candidatus Eisenbergiella merdigallinarum TaxID=2838552 RepID=A0A9D2SCB4_9FIRM|nr:helix-turn-helix domain-containing protein [Candidatus Eisenbergiella merdigallinarum]
MNQDTYFSRRLHGLFIVTDATRSGLAKRLKVPASTVRAWEDGTQAPNVYEFREIAAYFGLPYDWFLDGTDGLPESWRVAEYLGLSEDVVEDLAQLSETAPEEVLDAVDDAIYNILSAVSAAQEKEVRG